MKKKIIITLAIWLVVRLTSAAGFAVKGIINSDIIIDPDLSSYSAFDKKGEPSEYRVGISCERALESDKPMLALFYVDWCGYCLRFMPKFKVLSMLYITKYNFVMLNVEDPANKDLVEDVALTGFPTVYVIDPKYDNRFLINNAIYQNLPKFRTELDRYLRIRGLLDKASKK